MSNYRSPKTCNEMRATSVDEVTGVKVRAKRRWSNLPNAWDDLEPKSRRDRSWKNFRNSRYKTVDIF